MPRKRQRQPIDIDECDIDFSTVSDQAEAKVPHTASVLLAERQEEATEDDHKHEHVSAARAFDPALQAYVQRSTTAGRRRKLHFGGAPTGSGQPSADTTTEQGEPFDAEGSKVRTDQLLSESALVSQPALLSQRRAAYEVRLHNFCQRGLVNEPVSAGSAFPSTPTQTNSLLQSLWERGVPDIEPWDRWAFHEPRYDAHAYTVEEGNETTIQGVVDLVHHPLLPETLYSSTYLHRDAEKPVEVKLVKTKDELRAERRKRLQERQKQKAAAAQAQKAAADGEHNNSSRSHDRLTSKHLTLTLFTSSVMNPLAAEKRVLDQYEQRFLDHQRRNHDRHVAALPHQIAKRELDVRRHAEERPQLRAYRIFPIFSAAHLGKLRGFANDTRLRGFILWVEQCDALVVLTGGEAALRHLDRWMLEKMAWEHPDTRAVQLCRVPLPSPHCFSFHRAGRTTRQAVAADSADPSREAVFLRFEERLEDGEAFLRTMPAAGSPWKDLAGVWRTAFLASGARKASSGSHSTS